MRRNNKVYKMTKCDTDVMTIGTTFSGTSDVPSHVEIAVPDLFGRLRVRMGEFHRMLPDFVGHINSGRCAELQCDLLTAPDEIVYVRFYKHKFWIVVNYGETFFSGEFDTVTDVSDTTYL